MAGSTFISSLRTTSLIGLVTLVCQLGFGQVQPGSEPIFEVDVAPIFKARCEKCHAGDKPKAGLAVGSFRALVKGGDSGPAIVPGQTKDSLLVELIRNGQMPPEDEPQLTPAEIEKIANWVASGARAREHVEQEPLPGAADASARQFWAFRPLAEPPVPAASVDVAASAVDVLVHLPQAEHGLDFSPTADRHTLLRRLSLDLTGLPPTPQEIQAFVDDHRPDAYERLVDRLLDSPHFGERWGRHWLDAAGYSDITGGDNDAGIIKFSEGKWKYRDYVVRSFNTDKPYERFLIEQLAGDELVDWRNAPSFTPEIEELLIATGFLRNAADDTDEKELTTPDILNGVLQRTSEVVASNLLGLTLNCAKCHDHKYEPISQRDYYRLLALFTPSLNPAKWLPPKDRKLADISPTEKTAAEKHNGDVDRETAELLNRKSAIQVPYIKQLRTKKLAPLPDQIRDDVQRAIETAVNERTAVQKYLAEKFGAMGKVATEEIATLLTAEEAVQVADIEAKYAQLMATRRTWGAIQAVYEVGPPPETHLLRRGNHETPGPVVEPGFLSSLCAPTSQSYPAPSLADELPVKPQGATSGRRLALAYWLTDWHSPAGGLVARVWVNRVWQHLFGRGLVETSENLGLSGARPTHPQLLEWLACRFVSEGRQLKPLLKLIVTSNVYRQASAPADSSGGQRYQRAVQVDPANQWLWRMPIKRLEAEVVRDCILAASGRLDRTLFGAPLELESKSDGSVVVKEKQTTPQSTSRRSLYVLARRNYHLSMLNVFDQPAMSTNCVRRQQSAVVLQSLAMLNDAQVLAEAEAFASRAIRLSPSVDPDLQTKTCFEIALGRLPTEAEQAATRDFLAAHTSEQVQAGLSADQASVKALVHLCHMLLNSNEFLYVP